MNPVPLMQQRAEFGALLALLEQERPDRILEIGVYRGGTLWHWLALAGERVVAIDLPGGPFGEPGTADVEGWQSWAADRGVELLVHLGDSRDQAARQFAARHGPYDLVFIDGGHAYETVRADWEHYGPLGRIVVLHDILPEQEAAGVEAHLLWAQIRGRYHTTELVCSGGQAYGGIGIVWPS